MSDPARQIDSAYKRVAVLKAIVREERKRAETNPEKDRNVNLGITQRDIPIKEARRQIAEIFNEIDHLLEHLHILHMAASFELEALPRLGNVIGDTRKSIISARGQRDPWPEKLVRALGSFAGLHDIEQILSLRQAARESFEKIRTARNKFSHGVQLTDRPQIDAESARQTLYSILQVIR